MMWLLRLIAAAAAFFFLRQLFGWLWRRVVPAADRREAPPVRRGTLVRDPVCGTHVDAEFSLQESVNNEVVHFCSERCREAHRAGRAAPTVQHPG
jgi:YHS domain-containing protein